MPQVGSSDENELILTAVLDALHETLLILLRGQVCNAVVISGEVIECPSCVW